MNRLKLLLSIALALFGIYWLYPLTVFEPALSQGDHGLSLYAAEAVRRGQVPYRDFHWFYGPLMPYVFAGFFQILGVSIQTILFAKTLFIFVSGFLIYLTLLPRIPVIAAALGAIWFWCFRLDFFYTYNHSGAMLLSIAAFFCLARYLKSHDSRWLNGGYISCFLTGLVKLNIGGACLIALFLSLWLDNLTTPGEKRARVFPLILTGLGILGVNLLFIWGLPMEIVRQCFQYFGNDTYQSLDQSPKQIILTLASTFREFVAGDISGILILALAAVSIVAIIIRAARPGANSKPDRGKYLALWIPVIWIVLYAHEYLLSGALFRIFWVVPFTGILLFTIIFDNFEKPLVKPGVLPEKNAWLQSAACLLLLTLCLRQTILIKTQIAPFLTDERRLQLERADVFLGNSRNWITTVSDTTRFLKENLREKETFLALPYEPLYFFLTNRLSPTRQLVVFPFLNITEEQQRAMIENVEAEQIRWVVLSNRFISMEPGLEGVLGMTHAHLIGEYLNRHFVVAETFGAWGPPAGWMTNHAVRILKRNSQKNHDTNH